MEWCGAFEGQCNDVNNNFETFSDSCASSRLDQQLEFNGNEPESQCNGVDNSNFENFSDSCALGRLDRQLGCDEAHNDIQGDSIFSQQGGMQSLVDEWSRAQTPLFIELCSGCGILSACVLASGFNVMAVDHDHNKHKTKVKTFSLDLTKESSWVTLRHIVQNCLVIAVHMAPPCGTCSRAREIKLSNTWHGPQPLRNEQYPYGVPNMSSKDKLRVDLANTLYMHMCDFCNFLNRTQVPWTMENPTNSWLWQLPCMQQLVRDSFFTTFHSCAYGGARYKSTSFLTNNAVFLSFCKQCDGMHEHLAWGFDHVSQQFSTALEAEYPKPLCEEYARTLVALAENANMMISAHPNAADKLHPQKQRSGRVVPPLIPEYERVVSILLDTDPSLDNKRKLVVALPNIPAGSKLLRTEAKGGSGAKNFTTHVFGVFHGHEKFTTIARSLWHPFDELRHIPDLMIHAIFNLLHNSKIATCKMRLETLQKWRQWANELQSAEDSLRSQMPEHVRHIMQNKRLVLLEKLAQVELGWPDKELHKELCSGFRITGEARATGVFRQQPKPATMTEEELMQQSKFLRPAIIGKAKNYNENQFAQELYDITLREATEKQWLKGPYTFEEITERVGQQWLPVRRFCVEQKGKLRPIDDFCENRLNATFTTVDKITLKTMDHIVWAALIVFKHCLHTREMQFVLRNGEELAGPVHDDWWGRCGMRATALDLKSAYKQLPLHGNDANKTVVTIADPSDAQVKHFLMLTLPFGSSASVLHFNRVSWLLWALGCKLGILWSCYYDDYPLLCPDGLEQSSLGGAKALMNLLGFQFAEDKLSPPSQTAELLGVELDLKQSSTGVVCVRNKQDRIADIGATLDEILKTKKVKPKDLPSHLGRLQFADMQVAGRAGKLAMCDLRTLGTVGNVAVDLDDSQLSALRLLKQRMTSGKPRKLAAKQQAKPWILFTDGALEYNSCNEPEACVGALLLSPRGEIWYFGCKVPSETFDSWRVDGREHVIGLVELYACILALQHWKDLFKSERIILFVDNYGAQDCLVKGTSSVTAWRTLLMVLEEMDDELFQNLWVTRVPSQSNPADFPSRGSIHELSFLGHMTQSQPVCPIAHTKLEMLC